MNVLDLFSGIGGFSLGLERAGMQTTAFCEIDPYCRKVLARHWPGVIIHNDIRELDGSRYAGTVDVVCGGYPCQPFSSAGKQQGEADPRHLWPEMRRIVRQARPRWVVAENVRGHVSLGFDTVAAQMEDDGFTVWPLIVPASAIGAPHRRDRLWILAHNSSFGRGAGWPGRSDSSSERECQQALPTMGHPSSPGLPDWAGGEVGQPCPVTELERPSGREVERDFCGVAHGVSKRVDRLRALGNAVVPQIPEFIGRIILAYEQQLGLAA